MRIATIRIAWICHLALAAALLAKAATAGPSPSAEWNFTVYLNDREIGQHSFHLTARGAESDLVSEARFDVSVLMFSLYAYEHDAREVWQGNCLQRLQSWTDDNGVTHRVRGVREEDGFVVSTDAERDTLPECVMTFAYWNPRFREQRRLLNPQTGDYVDVRVEPAGIDDVSVRGRMVEANRYILRGKDLEITLWYSTRDDRWLALDSPASGGRQLRYRIK